MALYSWPITLPTSLLVSGFSEKPPDISLRTEMDAGPPKSRRRFSGNVRPINGSLIMTEAQMVIFDEFYTSTLGGGASVFDWTNPRTGSAVEFKFSSIPEYSKEGEDVWEVKMKLEIQP